jgi:hypothetical protein
VPAESATQQFLPNKQTKHGVTRLSAPLQATTSGASALCAKIVQYGHNQLQQQKGKQAATGQDCKQNRHSLIYGLYTPSCCALLLCTTQIDTKNEYDKVIVETEAAYLKILESSQTLLTVLKRESVNIQKKRQAGS